MLKKKNNKKKVLFPSKFKYCWEILLQMHMINSVYCMYSEEMGYEFKVQDQIWMLELACYNSVSRAPRAACHNM